MVQLNLISANLIGNKVESDLGIGKDSDQGFAKGVMDSSYKPNCSICGSESSSLVQSAVISSGDGDEHDESFAIVPVQKVEVASSSITKLIKESPEVQPGWPLLRHADQSGRRASSDKALAKQISVVQWAMRLPNRSASDPAALDCNSNTSGQAMVLVGSEPVTSSLSPNPSSIPKELEGFHDKYSSSCRLFSYQELVTATSNFLPRMSCFFHDLCFKFCKFSLVVNVLPLFPENLIGKGGSSQVFRGRLPDDNEVAVKILKPSEDVLNEFSVEIEIITSLSHKNIISLLGFCFEDSKFLLVYDFLSRGCLEDILHGISNL